MLAVLLLGAGFIVYSVGTHPAIQSHVNFLDARKRMNVLVGVQGTALDPGFVGFVAEIKPNSRVLNVIPIPGRLTLRVKGVSEPLYQAVSDMPPKVAAQAVAQAARIPIDHYFYLTFSSLNKVNRALYYDSPHWPRKFTPLTMLKILGYPGGRIHPQQEMELVREMINRLPLVSPLKASTLLSIPNTSVTNLSRYQLFLLANYVRGDQLVRVALPARRPQKRSHG